MVWRSEASSRTPKSDARWRWYRISHQNVGGVTNARGSFGVVGLDPITIARHLPRTSVHVLKHWLRAFPCNPDLTEGHYTIQDRLQLSRLDLPILYETHISRTGWGKRLLNERELEMAFVLPDFVRWNANFLEDIVPLQMLRAAMDAIFGQLSPVVQSAGKRIKLSNVTAIGVEDGFDRHWLNSLQTWLPWTWADTPIAVRAVKSDDAQIDFSPWRSRIQLALPWCREHLNPCLRNAGCAAGVLRRSFTAYLMVTYGRNWRVRMLTARRVRLGKRPQVGSSSKHGLKQCKPTLELIHMGVTALVNMG